MRTACPICRQPRLRLRKVYRRSALVVAAGYSLLAAAAVLAPLAALDWTGSGLLAAEEAPRDAGGGVRPPLTLLLAAALGLLGWPLRSRQRTYQCPRCDAMVE